MMLFDTFRESVRLDVTSEQVDSQTLHNLYLLGYTPREVVAMFNPRAASNRKVASFTVRLNEHGEYHVKARDQHGRRYPEADYFSDDHGDAIATANSMVRRSNS